MCIYTYYYMYTLHYISAQNADQLIPVALWISFKHQFTRIGTTSFHRRASKMNINVQYLCTAYMYTPRIIPQYILIFTEDDIIQ